MYEITEATLSKFKKTLHLREKAIREEMAERKTRAWDIAHHAATLLYDQFQASRVVVFGSLIHELWFSPTSDIDLAAWGISSEDYFVAVAKLQEIAEDFKIDLVAMEHCKSPLREVIEHEGKRL